MSLHITGSVNGPISLLSYIPGSPFHQLEYRIWSISAQNNPKQRPFQILEKQKRRLKIWYFFQLHNLLWLNYKPCLCSYWNKVTLRRLIESYSARATRFDSLDTKLIWLFWQLTCSQWLDSVSYAYRVQAVMWMLCVCEYTAACRTNIMK